jgi:hypothetical protein
MESESPLIQPPFSTLSKRTPGLEKLRDEIAAEILSRTGLDATGRKYQAWLGIDCLHLRSAIWMMRMMVASNVLARREGNFLYVPINPSTDYNGKTVVGWVERAYRVACAQGVI